MTQTNEQNSDDGKALAGPEPDAGEWRPEKTEGFDDLTARPAGKARP